MMRWFFLALAACASPARPNVSSTPVVTKSAPHDAQAPEVAPEPALPTGAMTVPDSAPAHRSPLEQIDTTISIAELRGIPAWPKPVKLPFGGEVLLALHADRDDVLRLSIVADKVGTLMQFPIVAASIGNEANNTHDGNTFPPRSQGSDYRGPIVFAIRTRPYDGAELGDQVAVFSHGATLRVAVRRFGGGDWEPRYQLGLAPGTKFIGIGTTYPH
jgi:hypothetical protein